MMNFLQKRLFAAIPLLLASAAAFAQIQPGGVVVTTLNAGDNIPIAQGTGYANQVTLLSTLQSYILTSGSGITTVPRGGTGLASGTSGGFLGFTGTTTMASTGAIAANHAITGGGAGAVPIDSLVTITKPATGSTLTIVDGKTLTASNTLSFAGTDSTVMTFPTTSATIARTDAANTFTGTQTFGAVVGTTWNGNTWATGTGTLSVGAAKTATFSNTVTMGGTDGATFNAGSGTPTYTFQNSSDTIVGRATTDTLTNKTLTSPQITGPVPVACGSSCTLGTANLGTYTRLDTAGGSVATLPGATGTGNVYRLYISVATTSAADKVLTNPTSDTIIGMAIGQTGGVAKIFPGNAGTFHSLQMPNAGTQPSGGFIGDTIICTDVASTIWKCDMVYQAGTTPTTPYSASTS